MRSRIRICIEVKSRIRIRIKVKICIRIRIEEKDRSGSGPALKWCGSAILVVGVLILSLWKTFSCKNIFPWGKALRKIANVFTMSHLLSVCWYVEPVCVLYSMQYGVIVCMVNSLLPPLPWPPDDQRLPSVGGGGYLSCLACLSPC